MKENSFSKTHQNCQAFQKGQAAIREYFEDLGKSWRKKTFSSGPSTHLTHPFAHPQHQKRRYRCCLNLRRCFGLEATVNPNALGKTNEKFNKLDSKVSFQDCISYLCRDGESWTPFQCLTQQ